MKSQNEELDPEGMPLDRQLKQHDEVQATLPGVQVTSPTPLSGKPSGYMVGSGAPGAVTAPEIAVEEPRTVRGNDVQEYKWPTLNLPDQVSAREIANDDTNPDGRIASRVQR